METPNTYYHAWVVELKSAPGRGWYPLHMVPSRSMARNYAEALRRKYAEIPMAHEYKVRVKKWMRMS